MVEDLWYKNAVIYSLDVDTFMDANGDGIGDFEGLMRRLDYLQALGVDTIWVAPFYPTPNRDNGYDVSDFYGVDPRHGSGGDFVEFVHHAERCGMKVIIDLVANHTSVDHPWFQEARSDPESRYRSWYIWSEERPDDWNSGMVFPGVQDRTWTYDRKAQAYYYHRFYKHQPDLNMDNPEVRAEIRRLMGYWIQQGVDGFRVDAVPFLIETTSPGDAQGKLRFDYLKEFRRFLEWRARECILLGETNVKPEDVAPYFGEDGGDGTHMMFNFWVNQHLFYALATGDAAPLAQALEDTRDIPATSQWAHFLRNHDELDLGRLSDEQRQTVFERFGPEEEMQLYGRGLRRRLAPMLGDRRQEELAYSLLFALPGTPVIRYGDEIGMGDDLELEERQAVRTPMQWAPEPQAGFSTAEETVHPVIETGVWGAQRVNVEAQHRDPDSLLNWMVRMIRMRKECPEVGWGEWEVLDTGEAAVLGLRYDWRGNSVLTLHNLCETPVEVSVRPGVEGGDLLVNLLEEEESRADEDGVHTLTLEAHRYRWFRVGGLNYAVRRERG